MCGQHSNVRYLLKLFDFSEELNKQRSFEIVLFSGVSLVW
jgi:hypothetical protein